MKAKFLALIVAGAGCMGALAQVQEPPVRESIADGGNLQANKSGEKTPQPFYAISPFAISLIPSVEWPSEKWDVCLLRLNLSAGRHRAVYGLDVGVMGNGSGQLWGVSIAGLVSVSGKGIHGISVGGFASGAIENIYGVSIGGIFSGAENMYGISIGGLCSGGKQKMCGISIGGFSGISGILDADEGVAYGISVCGLGNYYADMTGLQIAGVINGAKHLAGIQIGCLNMTEDMRGLQIGVVNFAKSIHGIQIGAFNCNGGKGIPFMPVLNAAF